MSSLLVKKIEFFTFCLNVNEGCYSIKVIYTKLIIIEMEQCEHVTTRKVTYRDITLVGAKKICN